MTQTLTKPLTVISYTAISSHNEVIYWQHFAYVAMKQRYIYNITPDCHGNQCHFDNIHTCSSTHPAS